MRTLPYLWLDVFTDRPFAGNALCVFLDGSGLSDAEMQALAKETNLSETTFVLPPTQAGATYRNRIFTLGGELAFAGHPTLGTAAALVLSGRSDGQGMVQQTKSGLTQLETYQEGGRLDRVVMYAPRPVSAGTPDPEKVARALNLETEAVTPNGLQPEIIEAGVRHLIVPVASVAGLQPDTAALVALSRELNVIGAYPFTLLHDRQTHIRARLFAPAYGISEDPATGSAAAPLGAYCYWHGLMPEGSGAFWYEQGIEMGRPSRLWVEVSEQSDQLQVKVGGQVRIVGKGEFQL